MRVNATLVLFLFAFMSLAAETVAQPYLTLNKRAVTLGEVFREIKRQTDHRVFYSAKLVDDKRTIDADFEQTDIRDVLSECLKGLPLTFAIREKTVVIKEKEVPAQRDNQDRQPERREREPNGASQPPLRIRIVDQEGNPLDGATVIHKPSKKQVITDKAGQATVAAQIGDELDIRFIGYKRETVKVESLNQQLVLALETEESFLDEAVVTSYENTTRRNTVGNVSSIDMKKIPMQNTSNSLAMLQGLATGLDIQVTGGMLGQASKVRVQGDQSLLFSAPPIYVIDGMVVSEYTTNSVALNNSVGFSILGVSANAVLGGGTSGGTQNARGNFMDFLDFNNIESITVLKDADAVAIYGSRAANGAIVITTKKATSNGLSIRANSNFQWQPRRLELMDTREYLQMRQHAIRNSNPPTTTGEVYHDINLFDPKEDNDWQDIVMGHSVMNYNLGFTLSSVQPSSSNRLSFDFRPNKHFFDDGGKHNVFALSNNYNMEYFKGKLQINNITNIGYTESNQIAIDFTQFAIQTPPNFPREVWDADDLVWSYKGQRLFGLPANHPLKRSRDIFDYDDLRLMNTLMLQMELNPHFFLDVNYGVSTSRSEDHYIERLNEKGQQLYPSAQGNYRLKNLASWNHNIESFFSLKELHLLPGLVFSNVSGVTYSRSNSSGQIFNLRGRPIDAFSENMGLYDYSGKSHSTVHYRYFGLYNRMSTRYHNILFNINYRFDGSSRFAPERRWSSFYSIALGWNLSNEHWFSNPDFFLKPRISYGTVGNDNIPDYAYLVRYSPLNSLNFQNNLVVREQNLYSENYKWEHFGRLNAGLDFKYKSLTLVFDYTNTMSRDQLIDYKLPEYLGQTSVFQNFPGVFQNQSFETNIGYSFDINRKSTMSINLLLTFPKDKLVAFPGLETSSYARNLVIGKSKSMSQFFDFEGVDQVSGRYVYKTSTGERNFNKFLAANELIETPVLYYGSFLLSYRYRQFSVSTNLFFRNEKNLVDKRFDYGVNGYAPGSNSNEYRFLLSENFDVNPDSPYQKFLTDRGQLPNGLKTNLNSYYFKINNLSVNYSINKSRLANRIDVAAYVSNILLKTNRTMLNYERLSNTILPQLVNTGLNVNFIF